MSKKFIAAAITLATISSTSAMAASYVPAAAPATPAVTVTAPATTDVVGKMTVKVGALYVRSKAKIGKNVVGVLKKGTEVDVKAKSGKWCQITFKDKDAFVACKYLK